MYKYFKHTEISAELWDKCIENSQGSSIYALSWYLNIASPGWDAIIKTNNEKYLSVFPLPVKRKLGVKIISNPVFCHQLGLFSVENITENDFDEIFQLLKYHFKYISSYRLNILNSESFNYTREGFKIKKIFSYHLKLDKTYSDIFKNFASDRRRNIVKSRKNKLSIEEVNQIEELLNLFKESVEVKIYGGVSDYQYNQLRRLFETSNQRSMSRLYAIRNEKREIIYSCLLFFYKDLIVKFMNAGNEEAREKNCDSFFMEYVIKEYEGSKYTLDFERDSTPGVNYYKESYNPNRVFYKDISFSRLSFPLRSLLEIRKFLARLLK